MRSSILAIALFVVAACGGSESPPPAGGTSTSGSGTAAPASGDACDGHVCPDDAHCELQTVQCVRAPCDPVPTCVTGMHPCAAVMCATNTRCEARDGQANCIPLTGEASGGEAAGVPCGRATCAEGMVCCNASCGVCTPPDGMCTQQFCGE